ncbi:thioredoxin family protein [Pedobacter sp. SYSU D00535]|uniref:thioredoxin family protein n=1 Tax=Pedobacter sp. SYSU D00535 TaxID=2810308 RepID=UPI001A9589FF|nr:thioredoxin family protein [Pedobacter sp. SYSU D00535]
MKQLLSIALLFVASLAQAQEEKGMKFEHANSWAEVKAKAKAENKYIFLDAYTTWCGPCIMMAKEIFPLKEVGDFYNANFINVKVQLDETAKDSEEVKKWRSDAKYLADTYSIRAYPTYLFFNPDGEVVHRAVGSSPGEVFISKGKDALDPDKQYYTLKKQYLEGKTDTTFLLKVTNASIEAYDADFSKKVAAEYLATQTDLLSPQNLKLLARTTEKTSDRGFAILKNNVAKADEAIGKGRTKSILHNIAMREFVMPALSTAMQNSAEPDWTALQQKLNKDIPEMAQELVLSGKPMYYM